MKTVGSLGHQLSLDCFWKDWKVPADLWELDLAISLFPQQPDRRKLFLSRRDLTFESLQVSLFQAFWVCGVRGRVTPTEITKLHPWLMLRRVTHPTLSKAFFIPVIDWGQTYVIKFSWTKDRKLRHVFSVMLLPRLPTNQSKGTDIVDCNGTQ